MHTGATTPHLPSLHLLVYVFLLHSAALLSFKETHAANQTESQNELKYESQYKANQASDAYTSKKSSGAHKRFLSLLRVTRDSQASKKPGRPENLIGDYPGDIYLARSSVIAMMSSGDELLSCPQEPGKSGKLNTMFRAFVSLTDKLSDRFSQLPSANKKQRSEHSRSFQWSSYVRELYKRTTQNKADINSRLLSSNTTTVGESALDLLYLQFFRIYFTECITKLFQAVPTGSYAEKDTKTIRTTAQDIDINVGSQELSLAKEWIISAVGEEYESILNISILRKPFSLLPCLQTETTALRQVCMHKLASFTLTRLQSALMSWLNADSWQGLMNQIENGQLYENTGLSTNRNNRATQVTIDNLKSINSYIRLLSEKKAGTSASSFENDAQSDFLDAFEENLPSIDAYVSSGSIFMWVVMRTREFRDELYRSQSAYTDNPNDNSSDRQINLRQDSYLFDFKSLAIATRVAMIEQYFLYVYYRFHPNQEKRHFYYQVKYIGRAVDHASFDTYLKSSELQQLYPSIETFLDQPLRFTNPTLAVNLDLFFQLFKGQRPKTTQEAIILLGKAQQAADLNDPNSPFSIADSQALSRLDNLGSFRQCFDLRIAEKLDELVQSYELN